MQASDDADASALATAVGSVFEGALGLEPTRVRVLAPDPELTLVVEGTTTTFERSLYAAGELDLIERERRALRLALSVQLQAAVERTLGRAVSTLSGSHDAESGNETLQFSFLSPGPTLA